MPASLIEKLVHDFLLVTEIRSLKPIERICQIQQTAPGGSQQNAEGPGDLQALVDSRLRAFALVDQNEIGMYRQRKNDCRSFPGV